MKNIIVGVFIALIAACSAQAQTGVPCDVRAKMVAQIEGRYSEARYVAGAINRHVFEMWGNPTSGTWTITRTDVMGIMCMLASGNGFKAFDVEPVVPGEDT